MRVLTFGQKLRKLRISNRYTQKDLAKLLGYQQRRISDLEGLAFAPKEETLIIIARIFGISTHLLLSDYQGEIY